MSSVSPLEVAWTLAAVPGLAVWLVNLRSAWRSLRAARHAGIGNGRLIVARYNVRKTLTMIYISAVFVLIGAVAMLRPPNPSVPPLDLLRILQTVGLLSAPALISYIGVSWRRVEYGVLRIAEHRNGGKSS